MAQSVTLSSVGTATMVLNPLAKSTTVLLSQATTGSSVSLVSIEMSLDDPTISGGPTATWAVLSSGANMSSSTDLALVYTVLSPVGMVRLKSSTLVASSGSWTLKALQSVTA